MQDIQGASKKDIYIQNSQHEDLKQVQVKSSSIWLLFGDATLRDLSYIVGISQAVVWIAWKDIKKVEFLYKFAHKLNYKKEEFKKI